ncbi:MAG: YqgE/AlgH family protein [Actinomycetota bacterium]|nr:YqgE/AlgH family protein [Actinomycetota bacterium]
MTEAPRPEASLTGRLLVASPLLADSNFERAVILVLDHDEDGALGVVVNRPTRVEVGEVLPSWQPYTSGPGVVFQGGPVALDSALALAAVPSALATGGEPMGWRRVVGGLGLVDLDTPPELLAAEMAALRVFAGYAGWSPGQLETELDEGAWHAVDAQAGDAFSGDPRQLWRRVLRRQRGELAWLSTYPDDVRMN